jgi:hypothetical protein
LSFIFDASDKLRVKGVGDAGNYHPDREAALAAQGAGQQVGLVIQPGHDLPDPDAGFFRNARLVIDDRRDGLFGEVGGTSREA